MFDKQAAISIIQDSLNGLYRAGTIKAKVNAKPQLVLMGSGADETLDSLGFVTFIMDLEDRLETITDEETPIILTEIAGFDVNNPSLTVETLADQIVFIGNKLNSKSNKSLGSQL